MLQVMLLFPNCIGIQLGMIKFYKKVLSTSLYFTDLTIFLINCLLTFISSVESIEESNSRSKFFIFLNSPIAFQH